LKLLWGRAGAHCSKCKAPCTADQTLMSPTAVIGENAHIRAHSPGGPRYDAGYSSNLLDQYQNLILLCPTCHTHMDKQGDSYSVEAIEKWKSDHETSVSRQLQSASSNIGFKELELIICHVMNPVFALTQESSTKQTPPLEKLKKNGLTIATQQKYCIGTSQSGLVSKYVEQCSMLDSDYPERLKAGFTMEYQSQKQKLVTGDALFESMIQFAHSDSTELLRQMAGLAVVSYLFEKCDLFEP